MWKDIKYGVRVIIRNPGFTIVAVLALALGIGATTTIFSVVDAVLLKPLPYTDPGKLVVVREKRLPQFPDFSTAPGNFISWQQDNSVFQQMGALAYSSFNLIGVGEPERLIGGKVTDGFFAMLGVRPQIGRDFNSSEQQTGQEHVAIISDGLWKNRFGAVTSIVGRTLNLDGIDYSVIGIMPPGFVFNNEPCDIWTPMAFTAKDAGQHGGHYMFSIGRLKPGVTLEQARQDLTRIASNLEQQFPNSNKGWSVNLVGMQDYAVGSVRTALLVLLGAVGFVLLIACVNVANLLLARSATRQKEMSIRTALGAARIRIIRQLLVESLILSILGGVAGLLIAIWGLRSLLALAPQDLLHVNHVSIDLRVLGFTALIAVLTSLLFGLAPALQTSNTKPMDVLKEASRGSSESGSRRMIRSALVVIEIALALVLLIGAGLMIKSFVRLAHVDPGFDPGNVISMNVPLPRKKYSDEKLQSAFFNQLLQKVSTLPGVKSDATTMQLPLNGDDYILGYDIQGRPPASDNDATATNYYAVSSDYFSTMGIHLIKGRFFTPYDTSDTKHVAIINETMARKVFPNEDPIGKNINVTNGPTVYREIVGVVSDVKQYTLDTDAPMQTYEPFTQHPFSTMTLLVKTTGDPTVLTPAIRRTILDIDPNQPVSRVATLESVVSKSLESQRFAMVLLLVFASVAALLAGVGIYGLMSYSVTQRTHEIGIRVALGAANRDVLRLVVGHGMFLTAIGIVCGVGGAIALTRLMKALLFEVSTTDVETFVIISVSLAIIALIACIIPALRAVRVDPMVALRES